MNEQIRISPIRLIGAGGEQLGLVPTIQALATAQEAGLDLVEVAADERPPVCRILDYGKLRFTTSQKGNKSKKVRQQKVKEIRLRPKTDEHDVNTRRQSGTQVSRAQRQSAGHRHIPRPGNAAPRGRPTRAELGAGEAGHRGQGRAPADDGREKDDCPDHAQQIRGQAKAQAARGSQATC